MQVMYVCTSVFIFDFLSLFVYIYLFCNCKYFVMATERSKGRKQEGHGIYAAFLMKNNERCIQLRDKRVEKH